MSTRSLLVLNCGLSYFASATPSASSVDGLRASNKLEGKADPDKETLGEKGRGLQSSGVVSQNDLCNIDAM